MTSSNWCLLAVIYICISKLGRVHGVRTIIDVSPTKGPIEGGTSVTIRMSTRRETDDPEYPSYVNVGDLVIPVEDGTRAGSSFVVTMPSVSGSSDIYDGVPTPISVEFSDYQIYATNFRFTYSSLTEITSFYPREYIHTGGIRLTIYGVGLDIAVAPKLEVSTFSTVMSAKNVWRASTVVYHTVCDEVNATRLVCMSPKLQLPAQIKAYLDGLYPVYNESYGTQSYTPPSVVELIDRGYVDDVMNNTMYIYVGVIFDGNAKYRNLTNRLGRTNGTIVLVPGPSLAKPYNEKIDLKFLSQPKLRFGILGAMVWLGFSLDDVSVFIEDYEVAPQRDDSIAPNGILFLITDAFNITPNASASSRSECPDKYLLIKAYIGYRYFKVVCLFAQKACDMSPPACHNNATCTNTDVTPRYKCACTKYFYGDACKYPYPSISNVFPLFGPVSGGTTIRIQLTVPPLFKPVGITLGSTFFRVADSSSTNFTIVSPPNRRPFGLPITVVFNLTTTSNSTDVIATALAAVNSSNQWNTSGQMPYLFQYRPDPWILDFSPKSHITTGGTTVTVTGSNLNAVAQPLINLTVIYQWMADSRYSPITVTASFTSPCTTTNTTNSTVMRCVFPITEIPTQFLYQLDAQPYDIPNSGGNVSSDDLLVETPSPSCPSTFPPTSGDSPLSTISFQVGFVLDGVNNSRNVGSVQVYPPPEICSNFTVFNYNNGQNMSFMGNHLLRGVTPEDYLVQIEDVVCDIIAMNDSVVVFRPRNASAVPTFGYLNSPACPDKSYPYNLAVTVAKNQVYHVGCVKYRSISPYICQEQPCVNNGTCNQIDVDSTAYTCTCQAENYGDNCENVKPTLTNMWPAEGTTSGGTFVTIRGNYSTKLTPVSVNFFGRLNTSYPVSNETESGFEMVFVTGRLLDDMLLEDVSFNVSVTFSDGYSWFVDTPFTFLKPPTFTGIGPRQHFLSGGTKLTIQGKNLAIALSPSMNITVHVRSPGVKRNSDIVYKEYHYSSPNCTSPSDEQLICVMPAIDPETADNFDDTFKLNEPIDTTDLFLSTATTQQLYIYVTLQFDNLIVNLTGDTNITNSTIYLLDPPQVNLPTSVINYYSYYNQTVELQGSGLQPGADCQSDVRVFIGGVEGTVTRCTETQFWLDFPENASNLFSLADMSLSLTNCTASGYVDPSLFNATSVYLIEVDIGYFNTIGGCVVYDFEIEQGDLFHLLGIYVGVAIGAAAVVVITIAIIT